METNTNKIDDDSTLNLSEVEIELILNWHDNNEPKLSPMGQRRLSHNDVEKVIHAWREKNGDPQLPINDYWQRDGYWRPGPNLAGLNLASQDLSQMDLAGIILSYANLEKADFFRANLIGAWLRRANLCKAHFRRAHLIKVSFYEANLTDTEFHRAKLNGASFRGAIMERTRLLDADLQGAYFFRARLDQAEMTASQLGGAIGEELERNYSAAIEAYTRLKANFESIGRYTDAGWAYRKERRMRKLWYGQQASNKWRNHQYRQALHDFFKWASNWFIETLCDYGESIWRVLAWMGSLLFISGPILLWVCGGLEWKGANREIYANLHASGAKWFYAYFQYLLYMVYTFTTANFSEMAPHNDAVRLISGFMSMFGIFLAGLLGFVAGNRIRNS